MYQKLNALLEAAPGQEPRTLHSLQNHWDVEMEELMRSAEKKCTKIRDGFMEFSPELTVFVKRHSILK